MIVGINDMHSYAAWCMLFVTTKTHSCQQSPITNVYSHTVSYLTYQPHCHTTFHIPIHACIMWSLVAAVGSGRVSTMNETHFAPHPIGVMKHWCSKYIMCHCVMQQRHISLALKSPQIVASRSAAKEMCHLKLCMNTRHHTHLSLFLDTCIWMQCTLEWGNGIILVWSGILYNLLQDKKGKGT